jgi:hypothetical protein
MQAWGIISAPTSPANMAPVGHSGQAAQQPINGAVSANGQLRQPTSGAATTHAVNAARSLQHTGVNGVIAIGGAAQAAAQQHLAGTAQTEPSIAAKVVQQSPAGAGNIRPAVEQSDAGSSDREGGTRPQVGVPASTSRSEQPSSAQTNVKVNALPGDAGEQKGRGGSPETSEEKRIQVSEGCIACAAGERCVMHDMDAFDELKDKLEWASKAGQAVSVHIETAYEIFGEAVLQWLPLAGLGEMIV